MEGNPGLHRHYLLIEAQAWGCLAIGTDTIGGFRSRSRRMENGERRIGNEECEAKKLRRDSIPMILVRLDTLHDDVGS